MSELIARYVWRWIDEERKFFQLYRGWRCRVRQREIGDLLWEYRAEYDYDGVFRGCYGAAATQRQAEKAVFDAIDMLMGPDNSITDLTDHAVAEPHSKYRRPLRPDENETERLSREIYVRQDGGGLSAKAAFAMAIEFLKERDQRRREASDAKPQG